MGTWIKNRERTNGVCVVEREYKCSECGYPKDGYYHDLRYGKGFCYFTMPNYCEYCGDKKSNTFDRIYS